jgi:hypothetical protein
MLLLLAADHDLRGLCEGQGHGLSSIWVQRQGALSGAGEYPSREATPELRRRAPARGAQSMPDDNRIRHLHLKRSEAL